MRALSSFLLPHSPVKSPHLFDAANDSDDAHKLLHRPPPPDQAKNLPSPGPWAARDQRSSPRQSRGRAAKASRAGTVARGRGGQAPTTLGGAVQSTSCLCMDPNLLADRGCLLEHGACEAPACLADHRPVLRRTSCSASWSSRDLISSTRRRRAASRPSRSRPGQHLARSASSDPDGPSCRSARSPRRPSPR